MIRTIKLPNVTLVPELTLVAGLIIKSKQTRKTKHAKLNFQNIAKGLRYPFNFASTRGPSQ